MEPKAETVMTISFTFGDNDWFKFEQTSEAATVDFQIDLDVDKVWSQLA